jgi:hypothetical protein
MLAISVGVGRGAGEVLAVINLYFQIHSICPNHITVLNRTKKQGEANIRGKVFFNTQKWIKK